MKRSTAILWVLIICLIALAIRLFFSFQSPYTSYDSYNVLRQVDAIKTTGLPIYSDELSYSGRTNVFSPLYYYVLAFFGLFIPTQIMVKILPNIFMSLLVLVVFFISLYISKNRLVSVISAFFSAFIPILFFNTFNRAPAYSLVLPMVFLFIYFILRINEDLYARLAILLVVLLVFTHAFSFVLIPVLLFYLVLVKLQALDTNTREVEMAMFITFFIFWFNLILYKKAFLAHGASVIWQNIPFVLLTRYYVDLSLFQIIFFIGLVPLFFGVYSIYANFFKQKKRSISLIVSFVISIFLLLLLKLISFQVGLMVLSILLVILSSYSLKLTFNFFSKTKFSKLIIPVLVILLVIFLFSSVLPILSLAPSSLNTPSVEEVEALNWLKSNTEEDSSVLSRVEEGYIMNYFASRKNVMDPSFLFVSNINQRYSDINDLFSARLEIDALKLLTRYDVDYIYFSNRFKNQNDPDALFYASDPECFEPVYNQSILIYKVKCDLK